ncbi:MAG: ABC transporter permease [Clostridia bacterium]|nr:ABC transporter permease [Clostridia bacterium]
MQVIIKFILRNMKEKKFRTFLIIFALIISSALYFAAGAVTKSVEKMYLSQIKRISGSSDITIHKNTTSPSPYFGKDSALTYQNRMEYLIGTVIGQGKYEYKKDHFAGVELIGIHYEDLQKMNPVTMAAQKDLQPFNGRKVIIGKTAADKYGIKVGDRIEFIVKNESLRLDVCAIAKPVGPFSNDGQTLTVIIPKSLASFTFSGQRDQNTDLYIKLKEGESAERMLQDLTGAYKYYTVEETLTKSDMEEQLKTMRTALTNTSLIVLFISAFIIYTCFKVITTERLPIIGTFRSIGAEKMVTSTVMLLESLFYGVVGGSVGSVLGVGVLYGMVYIMTSGSGAVISVEFSSLELLKAFFMALLLAIGSSLLPIIKISRIPIKEVVLNKVESKGGSKKRVHLLIGLGALAIATIGPRIAGETTIAALIDISSVVLCLLAAAELAPYITNLVVKLVEKLYAVVFGNIGVIAARNLRDNKAIINNITLLGIGISTILVINIATGSVMQEIVDAFAKSMLYQSSISYKGMEKNFESRVKSVDVVDDTYMLHQAENVEVDGTNAKIMVLQGIDIKKHRDYYNVDYSEDAEALINKLETGRFIVVGNVLKTRFKLEVGDSITIKVNDKKRTYQVIGFMNTLVFRGDYAIISEKYFKVDIGDLDYSTICIRSSGDPGLAADELKDRFSRNAPSVTVLNEVSKDIMKNNDGLFKIQKGLSIMTMIIGIFGIANNLIISFIERKRSIAIYRSVGMGRQQVIKMIFIEAITGGFIGGFIGVACGVISASVIPYMMKAVGGLSISIRYQQSTLILAIIAGAAITIAASISPAMKSSKLNIIESIKFE